MEQLMKPQLTFLIAGSLLSFTAFAGQWNCVDQTGGHTSLVADAVVDDSPIASAPVPAAPTAPDATEGKILLAGDAPCNPKVKVCED